MTCIVDVVNLSGTCLCANVSGDVVLISGQAVVISSSVVTASQVVILGNQIQPADQDIVTKALTQLGHPHDEIHDGTDFVVSDMVLNVTTFLSYLVITSSPKIVHMLPGVATSAECIVRFKESPTVQSNGTPLTTIVRSRISGTTSITTVFTSSTYTSGTGTLLEVELTGAGKATPGFTSEDRNEHEFNLKMSGTIYLLEIQATAASDINTHFHWYEV